MEIAPAIGTLIFTSLLVISSSVASQTNLTKSATTTTTTSTTTPTPTTPTPSTTTRKSYFPPGPERNAMHNLHPNEEEVKLLQICKEEVDAKVVEWKSTGEKVVKKFDWRKERAVLPVIDMKECSAAYAFSIVSMLESQFKITHGELKPFSIQQLIDCCMHNVPETFGCSGGRASQTLACIQTLAGLQTHRDYPWEGKQGQCRYSQEKAELQVKGYHAFAGEETIRYFVWKRGPVTVYINPALLINDYRGGIIGHNANCDRTLFQLTHMVVIVGFGESASGVKYWIVRNSWGPRWGYSGYFHIERGANVCGIETLGLIGNLE